MILLPLGEGGSRSETDEGRVSTIEQRPLTLSRKNDDYRRRALKPSPAGRGKGR